MESQLVKYGSFELETAEAEEDLVQQEDSSEFMKVKEGRNVVRFLPPLPPAKTPFAVIYEHYIDIPGTNKRIRFVCPRMMEKKPCPACQDANSLRKAANPLDKERAWNMKPKRRVYANVIDRSDEEAGVKVLPFGKGIHEALLGIRKDPDAGDFTNPTAKGFDIVIKRKGTGKNDTEYDVSAARGSSALSEDATKMSEWIEEQFDLQTYVKVPAFDEIEKMMSGGQGRRERGTRERQEAAPAKPQPKHRTAQDDAFDVDPKAGPVIDVEYSESEDEDDGSGW